ncbi:hypothetical protein ZWY2020_006482 [Hordeum vulgare]|nr:hypothetical protein ZWY2020_006482 [Hordeum vulgare]
MLGAGGFYYMDTTLEDRPPRPHLAAVTLVPGLEPPLSVLVTPEVIQSELYAYIGDYTRSSFSWVVSKMAQLVFFVPFPFMEMLNVCTFDIVMCPINKFLIFIKIAEVVPDLGPPLEQVWIYIFGLPEGGNHDHILNPVSKLVCKLLTVDVDSLARDGPASVEILCQSSTEVEVLSHVLSFRRTKGFHLTYELDLDDLDARMIASPPPPPSSTRWGQRRGRSACGQIL